jgi:hypothetical protein
METNYRRRQPKSRLERLLARLMRRVHLAPVQVDFVLDKENVEFRRA